LIYTTVKSWVVKSSRVINHIYPWQHQLPGDGNPSGPHLLSSPLRGNWEFVNLSYFPSPYRKSAVWRNRQSW